MDCNNAVGRRRACDGRQCFGFCGFVDALIEAASCRILWDHSPLMSIADQPNVPNQPFIIIRRLHDESVTRSQEALVDELCAQLVLNLSASSDRARSTGVDSRTTSDARRPFDTATAAQSVEVPMSVLCNAALERLLGFTQNELRELFSEQGDKALYGLVSEDDWPELMQLDKHIRLGWKEEGRLLVMAVNKRHEGVQCVLSMQSELDRNGKLFVTYVSFAPLPTDSDSSWSRQRR